MCILYLKRSRVVLSLCFIPIALLLYNTQLILELAGQNKEVAKYSATYIMAYLPGLYIQGLIDCQRRFLNSMKKYFNVMLIQGIAVIFHIGISHLFVDKLGYGIEGTGLAGLVTNAFVYILLVIYTNNT